MSLIADYLSKTKSLYLEYGCKSVVLMQVGAFYEVYGLKDNESIEASNIEEFSNICDLSISNKNVQINGKQVLMAGFRDYTIDKYIKKLNEHKYTVAVWKQDEQAAGTTRSLSGIFSPGTYFDSDTNHITNNTMCIWFHKYKNKIVVGISNIDIYTGKSNIFEYETLYNDDPTPFDEVERFVSIFDPNEIIICHNISDTDYNKIINYLDIKNKCLHNINTLSDTINSKKAVNCEKQNYQKKIIKKFYKEDIYTSEFIRYHIATQSFCYLLEFIYSHNPNLITKITIPTFENCGEKMLLANHSLKQLNIINTDNSVGKCSSVSSFLNKSLNPMGKRLFNTSLLNPSTNTEYLEREFNLCENIIEHCDIEKVRSMLMLLSDIEKLYRKIIIKKITPHDIYRIYETIDKIDDLYKFINKYKFIEKYLLVYIDNSNILEYCNTIKTCIKGCFDLDVCKTITNILTFDTNFIRSGYCHRHDMLVDKSEDSYNILEHIRKWLDEKISRYETKKNKCGYVKIYHTEKSGYSLVATQRRTTILKQALQEACIPGGIKIQYKPGKDIFLSVNTITYRKPSTGTQYIIESKQINTICSNIILSKYQMISSLNSIYIRAIEDMSSYNKEFKNIISFVSYIDLSFCKAHIAVKYNYCKPQLSKNDKSFVEIKGLRHILIEQILQDEIFVPNDIAFIEEHRGVLLYGTNAVGKSSFIKGIGISVILAQAGFFVPASSFVFSPYKHIFTRILGNDNIFKGLSTFAVEMLELKTILQQSDQNSLVIGDELCSGTEQSSAISIFLAGIEELYIKRCSFIFATHFHQIIRYEEITTKPALSLKHMSVEYNAVIDKLVYNRKLLNGPGDNMYGLEVCRGLHLPKHFIDNAHKMRNKYSEVNYDVLSWKPSRYNRRHLKGICENCASKDGVDVHHLQHQKHSIDNDYIDGFHKNSQGNLMTLCKQCHKQFHISDSQFIKQKTPEGFIVKEIN